MSFPGQIKQQCGFLCVIFIQWKFSPLQFEWCISVWGNLSGHGGGIWAWSCQLPRATGELEQINALWALMSGICLLVWADAARTPSFPQPPVALLFGVRCSPLSALAILTLLCHRGPVLTSEESAAVQTCQPHVIIPRRVILTAHFLCFLVKGRYLSATLFWKVKHLSLQLSGRLFC